MAELQDYTGPFKPDLKFEDFSKEALVKLINAYCSTYVGLMGCWSTADKMHMPSLSAEEAQDIVFTAYSLTAQHFSVKLVKKAAQLEGDDVIAFMKLCQLLPDGNHDALYNAKYDIKSNNDMTVTFVKCPTLEYYERKNRQDLLRLCCMENGTEEKAFKLYANMINPKMIVEPLKYPPRKHKDDICCKWRFYIPD